MTPYREVVQDQAGNVQPGRAVAVTIQGTSTPAPIYYDKLGLSPVPGAVVTTDENGYLEFWCAGGTLTLTVVSTGTVINNVYIPPTIVSSLMSSRTVLAAMALAGGIAASATSLITGCHTTSDDDGGAIYRRCPASEFASYGLSAQTAALVSFPDASGDRWVINTDHPTLASVGCFGQVLGASPICTAEYDCGPYITALGEFVQKCRTTGVVHYGDRNYYVHTNTNLPAWCGLSGPETQGRSALSIGGLDLVAGINYIPGVVLNPAISIGINSNFYAEFLCLKRAGIVVHTDLEGALDAQLAFAGTGLKNATNRAARGVRIVNFLAYGFAFGADFNKFPGLLMGDAYGDCNTLVMVRDSGDTVNVNTLKRKPATTNNDSIDPQSATIVGLYDAGGSVGLVMAEDVTALGLTTGQRVGNQKLPTAFVSVRRTVTVVDATHVVLEGEAWDSAYSSFSLTAKSSISWQPGCASGVTAFYNASGKVGVRTRIALPFKAGHQSLLGCAELAPRGMNSVLTRVSSTDFVLDVAWDAGLSGLALKDCEFAAMPNNRRHNSVITYNAAWNSTEGFAFAAIGSDGIRCGFATKGGSGFLCDSGSVHAIGSNEGGSIGELDLNDPTTRGLVVTQPRTVTTGAYKSTGTAYHCITENAGDYTYGYGHQFTDSGVCSIRVTCGVSVLSGIAAKGPGRIIMDDPTTSQMSRLVILHGEYTPDKVQWLYSVENKRRVSLRWSAGITEHQIAGAWSWWTWDASGNAVESATLDSNGFSFKPKVFTVPSGSLTLLNSHHAGDIELTGTGSGVSLDATTLYDGFRVVIRNHRSTDWAWPTSVGSGVVIELTGTYTGTPTKLKRFGEMTLTVRDISGTRYVLLRGDLTA